MHSAGCDIALNAQDTIKMIDLDEIRELMIKTPPPAVKLVMQAVAAMLGLKPAPKQDPANPAKTIQDWWSPGAWQQNDLIEQHTHTVHVTIVPYVMAAFYRSTADAP